LGDKGRIMSKAVEYMNINLERRDNRDFSHFDDKLQRGFTKSASRGAIQCPGGNS
jgi:hypothetical protein